MDSKRHTKTEKNNWIKRKRIEIIPPFIVLIV
jgi:hypothetical protein